MYCTSKDRFPAERGGHIRYWRTEARFICNNQIIYYYTSYSRGALVFNTAPERNWTFKIS